MFHVRALSRKDVSLLDINVNTENVGASSEDLAWPVWEWAGEERLAHLWTTNLLFLFSRGMSIFSCLL